MKEYYNGLKKGIPIALGYLAVSFAFGVYSCKCGMTPLVSIIISLTNLTSSGQFAGVTLISEVASYLEIGLTVLLINLRYSLMSISLSQKLDSSCVTYKRLLFGFGVTDEIYALAITEEKKLSPSFMFGLITLPIVGWTSGTALGVFFNELISTRVANAMAIALYAMFIAILIPEIKKSRKVFLVALVALGLGVFFYYVPFFKEISFGFKIIIITILAATFGALMFPIKEENSNVSSN